jgi:hypothetical protein
VKRSLAGKVNWPRGQFIESELRQVVLRWSRCIGSWRAPKTKGRLLSARNRLGIPTLWAARLAAHELTPFAEGPSSLRSGSCRSRSESARGRPPPAAEQYLKVDCASISAPRALGTRPLQSRTKPTCLGNNLESLSLPCPFFRRKAAASFSAGIRLGPPLDVGKHPSSGVAIGPERGRGSEFFDGLDSLPCRDTVSRRAPGVRMAAMNEPIRVCVQKRATQGVPSILGPGRPGQSRALLCNAPAFFAPFSPERILCTVS